MSDDIKHSLFTMNMATVRGGMKSVNKRGKNAGNKPPRELDASYYCIVAAGRQWVTKRCRLSWLTNSVLVYEPKCGGGESCGASAISTAVHRSLKKLWRSNSIFNLWWPRKFCHWHTWDHGFWCTRHWAAAPGRHFVPTAVSLYLSWGLFKPLW